MPLSAIIAFGTVFGAAEGIRAAQAKSRREENRSRKNNLVVHCPKSSEFGRLLEGRQVVLSGNKLYVDTGTVHEVPFGHPFCGYYLPYPDAKFAGLVSSITDEAPIMNWCYVDRQTHEWKFGTREHSEGNFTGPYDCTRQDRRLLFGGWEGFVAVREGDFWALYFDRDDDRLASKVAPGTPVIELELERKELRRKRPPMPTPAPLPAVAEPSVAESKIPVAAENKKPAAAAAAEKNKPAAAPAAAENKKNVRTQKGNRRRGRNGKKGQGEKMEPTGEMQQALKKHQGGHEESASEEQDSTSEEQQEPALEKQQEPLDDKSQSTGREERPTCPVQSPSSSSSSSPSTPTTPSSPASQRSAKTEASYLSATVEDAPDEE